MTQKIEKTTGVKAPETFSIVHIPDSFTLALNQLLARESELGTIVKHKQKPTDKTAHVLLVNRLAELRRHKQAVGSDVEITTEELVATAKEFFEEIRQNVISRQEPLASLVHYIEWENEYSLKSLVTAGLISYEQMISLVEYLCEDVDSGRGTEYYKKEAAVWNAKRLGDDSQLSEEELQERRSDRFYELTRIDKPSLKELAEAEELFSLLGRSHYLFSRMLNSLHAGGQHQRALELIKGYLHEVDTDVEKNPYRKNSKKFQKFEKHQARQKLEAKAQMLEFIARLGDLEKLSQLLEETYPREFADCAADMGLTKEQIAVLFIYQNQRNALGKDLQQLDYDDTAHLVRSVMRHYLSERRFQDPDIDDEEFEEVFGLRFRDYHRIRSAYQEFIIYRLALYSHVTVPEAKLHAWLNDYEINRDVQWLNDGTKKISLK